jgi:ArsR family transcriptional regulator
LLLGLKRLTGKGGDAVRELYELQADVCKIFSNSKRLEIINHLKEKELPAGDLLEKTGLSKANLSQHMSVLKAKGVILSRREGVTVYYRISNAKIIEACTLMREVLLEQIQEKGRMVSSLNRLK